MFGFRKKTYQVFLTDDELKKLMSTLTKQEQRDFKRRQKEASRDAWNDAYEEGFLDGFIIGDD
jgi:hypothetical protein